MRIWIINHYAVPLGGKSGARHAALAKYLRREGHEVMIFAASVAHGSNEVLCESRSLGERGYADETIDGVNWRFIRSRPFRNNIDRLLLMRDFGSRVVRGARSLPRPDVVIGSCVHPYAVEAGRRIAKRFDVPFVYEIRDIWPESLVDVGGMSRWHPAYLLFKNLENRAFRDADGVITLLPGIQDYAARHGTAAARICYLPNGIDPAGYPELPAPEASPVFRFSYLGAHGPANDLRNVLAAAKILQDTCPVSIRIQLVGDGPEKESLVHRASELGLSNVCFTAPLAKQELRAIAEQSDGFIFNLKRMPVIEKYGLSANKLFEYLINGRPVVFSCSSYNNPIAETGAGISVAPETPQALAEAMAALARTGREQRAEMGRRGREYALANHDLSRLAGRLACFLEQLVCGRTLAASQEAA